MLPPCPWSLLLLALFCPAGAGGRKPGTGGAPTAGGAADLFVSLPTMGAERSLTWVTFFSLAPFVMSPSSAPCSTRALFIVHHSFDLTFCRTCSC